MLCDPNNMAENQMCISKCLSQECHTEIYLGNELEPGEIDDLKELNFETCVKDQLRQEIVSSRRGTIGTLSSDKSHAFSGANNEEFKLADDDDIHEKQEEIDTGM